MKKILKVGIIIIIGTFFFFTFLKKKNPEEILSKAIQKTANLNSYHIDYNIETTIKMKGGKIEFSIDQKMDIDNTTKISYIEKTCDVTRITATSYLNQLEEIGLLELEKIGREKIYKNTRLIKLLSNN